MSRNENQELVEKRFNKTKNTSDFMFGCMLGLKIHKLETWHVELLLDLDLPLDIMRFPPDRDDIAINKE